jgi:hypothetical protein
MSLEMWDDDDDEPDDEPYQDDEPPIDLGPCCACGRISGEHMRSEGNYLVVETVEVRNIGMLSFRAPVAGKGWGCFQCGLPLDGAMVVVCDQCAENNAPYKWLIYGQPSDKKRIDFAGFEQVPFDHDMSKHPELQAR